MKNYLSELRNELPTNCLFDKGKVGCGGTTLAIESDKPYVIAVPFTSLVDNKVAQYPNDRYSGELFGVQQGVNISAIKDYVANTDTPKIITTYDSLPKVISAINAKDYYLLIDEYHILFTQYSFRSEAIKYVLNHYKDFKEYCFMTATPIEDEFILDELKDIPVVRQNWESVVNAKIMTVQCDSVLASTMMLIKDFLSGKQAGNAYFFLNSTKTIKNIIDKLNLTEDNTRVIYSKYSKIKMAVPNGSTLDEPKKINFLTSTAFEGSDIYDEEGRIFIVSDNNAEHSLLDISTAVQQIAGRIRNSKYMGEILHLYNTSRYFKLSYEDFKASQEVEAKRCKKFANIFNAQDEDYRELGTAEGSALYLVKNEDNFIEFDSNLVKVDTFNYKVATDYTVRINLEDVYKDNNFEVEGVCADYTKLTDLKLAKTTTTFKEAVELVESAFVKDQVIGMYIDKYPFLEEAINKLGFDMIKELRYNQKEIKNTLLNLNGGSVEYKVTKALNLKAGAFYTSKDLKEQLNRVYSDLNLNIKGKATDITKYYDVKEGSCRINNTKVRGYYILRALAKVTD